MTNTNSALNSISHGLDTNSLRYATVEGYEQARNNPVNDFAALTVFGVAATFDAAANLVNGFEDGGA